MSLPEVKFTKLFIDNKFVDSVSGATFTTVNPATEEPICKVIESLINVDVVGKITIFGYAKIIKGMN